MMNILESTSMRPYLIRALHEWCADNGLTPYVAVLIDDTVQVPREYVKNGEIVLNISYDATSGLKLGNDFIQFKARFAGVAREIMVPVDRVIAVYARENGQGMAFPMSASVAVAPETAPPAPTSAPATPIPEGERRVVQLVPDTPGAGTEGEAGGNDAGPSPRPPGGSGGRPSLKRVK